MRNVAGLSAGCQSRIRGRGCRGRMSGGGDGDDAVCGGVARRRGSRRRRSLSQSSTRPCLRSERVGVESDCGGAGGGRRGERFAVGDSLAVWFVVWMWAGVASATLAVEDRVAGSLEVVVGIVEVDSFAVVAVAVAAIVG